jgi:phosphoserine phosphatase
MYEKKPGHFIPRPFSESFWQTLKTEILRAKDEHQKTFPGALLSAAFDADGTLWDCDIGESFFDYQVKNCKLPNLKMTSEQAWAHYDKWKIVDPAGAYLWLAQINKGVPYSQVQKWAQEAVSQRKNGLPVFDCQKRLVEFLKENNFEIFVVTASVRWAVIPAAAELGILDHQVLGVQTRIDENVVTDEQFGPMTWREGKSEAILAINGGAPPVLAAGNTTGDTSLLKTASHIRLAVSSRSNAGDLEKSEQALQVLAEQNMWLTHQF